MHEVSIALDLLRIVSEQCRKGGFERIDSINLKIGRASGIMPDALLFAFDVVKEGSPAGGAKLNIEEVPVSGHCKDCGKNFIVEENYVLNCPFCGGTEFVVTGGRELDIIDMEVS
jgi:hydrogenase nickel incorporation protein HypA/HybF